MRKINTRAFTLIELLVVISIMGILLALSVFGMQEARRASRDSKRKADIEQIRSALEMYKADCSNYPTSITAGGSITGSCPTSNTYLSPVPKDPLSPTQSYSYSSNGNTYTICASLEQGGNPVTCVPGCGAACNYTTKNP